jgi:hypothetical protein
MPPVAALPQDIDPALLRSPAAVADAPEIEAHHRKPNVLHAAASLKLQSLLAVMVCLNRSIRRFVAELRPGLTQRSSVSRLRLSCHTTCLLRPERNARCDLYPFSFRMSTSWSVGIDIDLARAKPPKQLIMLWLCRLDPLNKGLMLEE